MLLVLAACGGAGDTNGTSPRPTPPVRGIIVASQVIDGGGGTVLVTNASSPLVGTQVAIPAGALSRPTTITISQVSSVSGVPADVLLAEVGPQGTVFAVPATVTMRYSPDYLASHGGDPTTLKVVAIDTASANETLRTVGQDSGQNTVSAQIARASLFGVMGYSLASLSGDYAMNFTMMDARQGPAVQIPVNVPATPFNGLLNVPFPAYGFRAEQGTVNFDGAGNYAWTAIRNVAGARTEEQGSGTYTISPDGSLALDFGVEGSVLAGGSTFVLAATGNAPVIEMGMGVKKGGSFGNASLSGNYAVALYYSDPAQGPSDTINLVVDMTPFSGTFAVPFPGYALNSELRTMIFDGAGNYTWTGTRNTSGMSRAVSGSGSYAVAADGSFTLDTGLTGHLLAGGSTLLLTTPSGLVQMGSGIRKSGTFSTASLGGRYTVAYQYADPNSAPANSIDISIPATPYSSTIALPFPLYAFNSEVRTITFDGNGSYTWTGKRDKGGTGVTGSGSGSYSVDADGVLTLDTRIAGHVLEGGSTFILAPTSGAVTQIGVGILK